MSPRGLTLRDLWLMAHARRRQTRYAMLPHLGGKFDRNRFMRTGHFENYGSVVNLPDTPAMREAKEALEREREMHERQRRGGTV